ncbi:MAG: class I SAM-dependent methyltransferase [Bacillaceae bacterium]|nr:class I SAM-dependent methyltransferase [Bacillaceae bacterium]
MPDHTRVYQNETDRYDQLISRQPDVIDRIRQIIRVDNLDIVDLGAGSGRLTVQLAPYAKSITAVDASRAMLQINEQKLKQLGIINWRTAVADHRELPLETNSADLLVSGWSICYVASSNVEGWEHNIEQVISEIKRVLRPGGTVIIFETVGTGTETPDPPDFLKGYYGLLEQKYGFHHTWFRLDYTFNSMNEAEDLTRFFFGDELADRVIEENLIRVPECAGMWWLKNDA